MADMEKVFDLLEVEKFCNVCFELVKALGSIRFAEDRTRSFMVRQVPGKVCIEFPSDMDINDEYVRHLYVSCRFLKGIDDGCICSFPVIEVQFNANYVGLEEGHSSRYNNLEFITDQNDIRASQNILSNAIYHLYTGENNENFSNESNDDSINSSEINFIYNLTAVLSTAGPKVLNQLGNYITINEVEENRMKVQMYMNIKDTASPLSIVFDVSRDDSTGRINMKITETHNGKYLSSMEFNINDHAISKVIPGCSYKFMDSLENSIYYVKEILKQ